MAGSQVFRGNSLQLDPQGRIADHVRPPGAQFELLASAR